MPTAIKGNFEEFIQTLDRRLVRQIPFASARALTRTAQLVQAAEVHEISDVFRQPTPYTLSAVALRPATKESQSAYVWIKSDSAKGTPAEKYLSAEIEGGSRSLKRFELALRSVGALPDSYYAVPGSGAKVDSYGNMDRGQIVQILAFFKAFPEAGYRANITTAGRQRLAKGTKAKQGFAYFVGRPAGGKLPLGVWQRTSFAHGSSIRPVLIFVPSVLYEPIFDFYFVASTIITRNMDKEFRSALADAVASAR